MGVTIQADMLEAARLLPNEQGRDLIYALVTYGIEGELPDEVEPWYPMWLITKGRIEASVKRNRINAEMTERRLAKQAEAKAEGLHQSSAPMEDPNGDDQRSAPEDATNENDGAHQSSAPKQPSEVRGGEEKGGVESFKRIESGTDDDEGSPMPDGPVPYGVIVGRLNERAGADYRPSSRATRRLIDARWREGYRLPDFESVIDAKSADWAGTEMAKYLRPQTLFGTKFESYRSQALMGGTGGGASDGWYDFASLNAE